MAAQDAEPRLLPRTQAGVGTGVQEGQLSDQPEAKRFRYGSSFAWWCLTQRAQRVAGTGHLWYDRRSEACDP